MRNIFLSLTRPLSLPHWWQDVLLAIPRIYMGILMSFYFGSSKFGLPWSPAEKNLGFFEVAFWFPGDVAEYGGVFAMAPAFLAWMAAFSEAVGGLFLIIGFQTRLFSFLIACTMVVAAFVQHGGHELWQQLPATGFLWVSLFTMVLGSGRVGLDFIISKKISHV
jgi:putative oxidoreductase